MNNLTDGQLTRSELLAAMVNSKLLVLGFTVTFVALGASATWLGGLLVLKLTLLVNIACVNIITFGFQQLGFLNGFVW